MAKGVGMYRLTKLSKNDPIDYEDLISKGSIRGLRTNSVEGDIQKYPEIGESIHMNAESLNPDYAFRLVTTSHIVKFDHQDTINKKWIFTTESGSVYFLERI